VSVLRRAVHGTRKWTGLLFLFGGAFAGATAIPGFLGLALGNATGPEVYQSIIRLSIAVVAIGVGVWLTPED
jgi:hypothetical protein